MGKIFLNLAKARVDLQEVEMTKTGKNKHLGFSYFELKDFLPKINEINLKNNIVSLFDFVEDKARLRIISVEDETEVIFMSDTAKAILQGKPSPIQELGSMHTYMRRYMYMLAYEIVDNDLVDSQGEKEAEQTNNKDLSEAQIKRLIAIAKSKNFDVASVKKTALSKYQVTQLEKLSKIQYDEMCKGYDTATPKT